jgi:hypothetical protein
MRRTIKFLGLIVLLGGVLFATSCSKKKTCECTVTVSVMGYTQSQTASGEIDDGECSDIVDFPELQQVKDALGGYGTMDISCHEK